MVIVLCTLTVELFHSPDKQPFFFFTETQDQISSAAPAAFHAEPHTYRTYAFIFCMVIFVSGKWLVGVCVQRRRRTIWRPYLLTYALHTSMQFDIWGPFYGQVTGVKSMYPLTSSTWPHRGRRLELNVFFFLFDHRPDYRFSLDHGLKYFPKL